MPSQKQVKRPTVVTINGTQWEVRWLSHVEWQADNLDDDARGLTRYRHRQICVLVEEGTDEQLIRDSFLHECQHAIWDGAALRQSLDVHKLPEDVGDAEEYLILRITNSLLNFLQYNPEALKYLVSV
jgi:hypothetical protein